MSVRQIRASDKRTQSPGPAAAGPPQRLSLTADELTILMSWAEAMAEALAFAPASIDALAADAQSGASWREELRVCEPSPLLRDSIAGMASIARAAVGAGSARAMETALVAADERRSGESALDGLARAVIRSALQQRQARQDDAGQR